MAIFSNVCWYIFMQRTIGRERIKRHPIFAVPFLCSPLNLFNFENESCINISYDSSFIESCCDRKKEKSICPSRLVSWLVIVLNHFPLNCEPIAILIRKCLGSYSWKWRTLLPVHLIFEWGDLLLFFFVTRGMNWSQIRKEISRA